MIEPEMPTRLCNPCNRQQALFLGLSAIGEFSIIFLFAAAVSEGRPFVIWLGLAVALAASGISVAALMTREFIQRPRMLELSPDGIRAFSRWGSSRLIPWNNLERVEVSVTTERLFGRTYRDAKVTTSKSKFCMMTDYHNALAIKEDYEMVTRKTLELESY